MAEKKVGIKFEIIGLGHAGSKLAEEFFKLGYKSLAINTSPQDLEKIKGPVTLAIDITGTGKDRTKALDTVRRKKDTILNTVRKVFSTREHALLLAGLGGGTGSGSIVEIAEYLKTIKFKHVSVLVMLPLTEEDGASKRNALAALKEISLATSTGTITSIMIADNSLMFKQFPHTKITEFWNIANTEIVKPLHAFNVMCTYPTKYTALDPQEFVSLMTTTGCMTFGRSKLNFYDEQTVINMLSDHFKSGLMAEGFDLYSAQKGGAIIIGDNEQLSKIPKESETLIFDLFSEYINGGTLFRGIYESTEYPLTVYSIIAGLDVPYEKVKNLKDEVKTSKEISDRKQFNVDQSAFDIDE